MKFAMNTQHFFDFLLHNSKGLPIHIEYIGDEEWFTSEIVFSINTPVSIVNGVYSLIHALPEKIEKFNIQFSLNSRADTDSSSKLAIQELSLDIDLSAFNSLDEWSKDLLIKLQGIIFNDALYNLRYSDSFEVAFKQAYQDWSVQKPTEPMNYTTDYKHHIFDSATLVHKYIVNAVQEFTKPNFKYF